MSINYHAYLEAVGPVEKIAAFKAQVLALPLGRTSDGVEVLTEQPGFVSLAEMTDGEVMDVGHMQPAIYRFAMAEPSAFEGVTVRVVLTTECVNIQEYVIEGNAILYGEEGELDLSSEGEDELPFVVHGMKGDPMAWTLAVNRYGVTLPAPSNEGAPA